MDESTLADPRKTGQFSAKGRPFRSQGASLPRNNREAKKRKPSPRLNPLKRQLLPHPRERNNEKDNKGHVGHRLQPQNLPSISHRPALKRIIMIFRIISILNGHTQGYQFDLFACDWSYN
jgi:hypothetical protein